MDDRFGKKRVRQVFLSYASDDREVAARVANALRTAGLRVWFDVWELAVGDSIISRTETALRASDVILVLLSPRSVHSRWVQSELGAAYAQELRDRAITVIPTIVEDCDIPPMLADRSYLDLRHDHEGGVQRLVQQLGAVPEIDFSPLDWRSFEDLVADLLIELGFAVDRSSSSTD